MPTYVPQPAPTIESWQDLAEYTYSELSRLAEVLEPVEGEENAWITPESFGAAGDGIADDTEAFDAAINESIVTGKEIRGAPGKTYYLASSPEPFTDTLRISDCSFIAPNGVSILRGFPVWEAENTTVSSLSATTINGTTVTRVNLTSTAGFAVGDWVQIGSSTVRWPANAEVFWFEASQIVRIVANSSIDLVHQLLGESSGALNANLRIRKVPDYRLEARNIRIKADGNVLATGIEGRVFAITLRGGIGHRLDNIHAESWWERFIRLEACIRSKVIGPSWDVLPDTSTDNEAFGYGIHETSTCFGTQITGMQGGRCRHAYTTGSPATTTYSADTPYRYGMSIGSKITGFCYGASGAAFDSHDTCAYIEFNGCKSIAPSNQPQSILTVPAGFQDRGYRTRYVACTASGGLVAFRSDAALFDWGALDPNIVEYAACAGIELGRCGLLLSGVGGNVDVQVLVNGMSIANSLHGILITSGFDGELVVKDMLVSELSGRLLRDECGKASIQMLDALARYTGNTPAATSPIQITAFNALGDWLFDNIRILRRTASTPNGFMQVDVASAVPVTLGRVVWDGDASLPMLSPSSVGGASLVETALFTN